MDSRPNRSSSEVKTLVRSGILDMAATMPDARRPGSLRLAA
jgi:hypothetical protein